MSSEYSEANLPPTLDECWKQVFSSLPETRRLLLGSPDIEFKDDRIIVTFRDAFTKNLFAENHFGQLEGSISGLVGRRVTIVVRSLDSVIQKPVSDGPGRQEVDTEKKLHAQKEPVYRSKPRPHFTFDGFVVGASNREAYEAARAVARWEDGFDTLFFTGPVGCGKTHLLWSAWRQVMMTHERVKTCYVSASDFIGHFSRISRPEADRSDKLDFDRLYSTAGLFLMDDIHDLVGRPGSQRQLRIFIEKLSNNGAYVMLSSKCQLADLRPVPGDEKRGFVEELYSRMCGFLSAEIRPPDFDLRVKILLSKAREEPVPFDLEIGLAQEIARRIDAPDVRPLEGVVKRLKIKVFSGQEIGPAVIDELISASPTKKLDAGIIMEIVAKHFGVSVEAIRSDNKMMSVVKARRIAFYLCRKLLPQISTVELGRCFAKDHSTVIQGANDIEKDKATDIALAAELTVIEGKLS